MCNGDTLSHLGVINPNFTTIVNSLMNFSSLSEAIDGRSIAQIPRASKATRKMRKKELKSKKKKEKRVEHAIESHIRCEV